VKLSSWSIVLAVSCLAAAQPGAGQSFLVTGEPFLVASGDVFTIQGSNGVIERNRAAVVAGGIARNLYLVPSGPPVAGSTAHACLNVDGVDTTLCVDYPAASWPAASVGNTSTTVQLAQGSRVSIHVTETGGVTTGQNYRASFRIEEIPLQIFADGFESGGMMARSFTVDGFAPGTRLGANEISLSGTPPASLAAMIVGGEPFLVANGDVYTIGGSAGDQPRNRAAVPRAGTLRNLFLAPNLQPAAGALVRACLNVNNVDTSLCVDYTSADGTSPKGNTIAGVAVNQGDVISVHAMELNGVSSGANVRSSFELAPVAAEAAGAVVITDEPFIFANADVFSIGGSSGSEERNRAAAVISGTIRNLFVVPNLAVAAGSQFTACVRVNGVDSGLCVSYSDADSGAKGNVVDTVAVEEGDLVTVHFVASGVSSGANVRASFELVE
jgi:hypothetical protein